MLTVLLILYGGVSTAHCFSNMVPQSNDYSISFYETKINSTTKDHKIPLKIWYPNVTATDITFPMLVFGHCLFGGFFESEYAYIWQMLVPKGYIVAMPMSIDVLGEKEFAADIRYSLDWIRDNCTKSNNCPLYNIIGTKSAVSGHSLGGGSAVYCIGNYWLGYNFKYQFDAAITLSGCGSNDTYQAAKNISKPVFFLDGNHDCMCSPSEFADVYYEDVSNDNHQCKYEALITNATHCNFADLTLPQDESCLQLEEEDCPHRESHLSVKTQNSIAAKYVAAFMNATLYFPNQYDSLNQMIQNDLKNDVLNSSASNNCN